MKKLLSLLFITLMFSVSVSAQQTKILLSSGSKGGTYSTMANELIQSCMESGLNVAITEVNTTGSIANVQQLVDNKTNIVFAQADVVYFSVKGTNRDALRVIAPLHTEQVHYVALRDAILKSGGIVGIGATKTPLDSVEQLTGLRVAAAGGSLPTAAIVNEVTKVGYNIESRPDNKALLAALDDEKVDAIVLVGGKPFGMVEALPASKYRLLTMRKETVDKMTSTLKGVYFSTELNYDNLRAMNVRSIEVPALLLTSSFYKSSKMTGAMGGIKSCLEKNIEDLMETTGNHPAWRTVNLKREVSWKKFGE